MTATPQQLAADLDAAGFRGERVRESWGPLADDATGRSLRYPALRSLGDRDDPLAVLSRLLVLGVPQGSGEVDRALPRTGAEGIVRLGVARRAGEQIVPLCVIRPQEMSDASGDARWWIASDLDELAIGGGALAEDHVLGVGGASLTLAGLQMPTPVERVLDLGTGCGIQALRARRYADEVVATDISERALRLAKLTVELNGVEGVEFREGSLFAPVEGELFDRIVSNPPFVITPRGGDIPEYEYRDGGMAGDDLVRTVFAAVGRHLRPGGVAQFLGNWETKDGVAGLDRVRRWVEESEVPLDAWVVEREDVDPLAYAELWIRDGGTVPGSPAHDALLAAWLDDFARRGVTSIGFGYVLLRRATGAPTLRRFERLTHPLPEGGLGVHYAEALAAHDRLATLDDGDLPHERLLVASDVTEARHFMPGQEDPSVIELRQGGGFARSLSVDPALAAFVGASDGALTTGQILGAIAQLMEVDVAALAADLLPRIREMLFTGFLRFADSSEGSPSV